MNKANEVLQEFIQDVNVVGIDSVAKDWPDLLVTYRKAQGAVRRSMTVTISYEDEYHHSFEDAAIAVVRNIRNGNTIVNVKVEDEFGAGAYVDVSGDSTTIQPGTEPWGPLKS